MVGQPHTSIVTLIGLHTLDEPGVLLLLGSPFHRLVTVLRVEMQVLVDIMEEVEPEVEVMRVIIVQVVVAQTQMKG